jgi:uncharacterized protein
MVTPSPYAIYRDHLQHGRLAYQFSLSAGVPVFFPRAVSPHDVEEALEWRISKGQGTVYSTTVIYPRDNPPYNVALVSCDEGFRMMSRVEQCPPEQVRIGMRVRFVTCTQAGDEDPCPVFIPEAAL